MGTEEPLEEEPTGVLLDVIDLEVPLAELDGAIAVARLERTARSPRVSDR
jgi:hypothetical protein